MRNAAGSIAALLVLAAVTGLAGPAVCGKTQAAAMPCCQERRDCGEGLGRPACCVDQPSDASSSAAHAAAAAAKTAALAATPSTPGSVESLPAAPIVPSLVVSADPSDSPPLFLLHSVFLC